MSKTSGGIISLVRPCVLEKLTCSTRAGMPSARSISSRPSKSFSAEYSWDIKAPSSTALLSGPRLWLQRRSSCGADLWNKKQKILHFLLKHKFTVKKEIHQQKQVDGDAVSSVWEHRLVWGLKAYLFWFIKAVWLTGIMLSGQGAVWLGGACCWEKWWPTIPMSISGWANKR